MNDFIFLAFALALEPFVGDRRTGHVAAWAVEFLAQVVFKVASPRGSVSVA
jgi:hypothetical protein